MNESLSTSLREARTARGWTQAQLAQQIGVSRKTINTVENGVFVPSTIVALKIARALECTFEELFQLTDEKQP